LEIGARRLALALKRRLGPVRSMRADQIVEELKALRDKRVNRETPMGLSEKSLKRQTKLRAELKRRGLGDSIPK